MPSRCSPSDHGHWCTAAESGRTLMASTVPRHAQAAALLSGECQLGAKCHEGASEDSANPRQYPRAGDDLLSHCRSERAVDDEDDQSDQHEDRAQLEHAQEPLRLLGAHELRQERKEEDRELGIEEMLIRIAEVITFLVELGASSWIVSAPLSLNVLHAM